MDRNKNKKSFKNFFKIILNVILSFVGLFCLIGSLALLTTTTTEYNEITNSYYEVREIGGGIFFGIIAIICLFFPIKKIIIKIKSNNKEKKEEQQKIKEYEEKRGIVKISSNVSLIEKEKIIILNKNEYHFEDIIGCELIEDGNSITSISSKKKSSLGKAVAGGVLFGGVGAIIGGTSGKTKSTAIETNYCNNLKLKITINNLSNPCEFIEFINRQTNKQSLKYKQFYEEAQKIISVIDIVCKNNISND